MTELQQILNDAKNEISRLRQRNYLMQARLDVFDQMMQVFNCQPPSQNTGISPDVVWQIERFIEKEAEAAKQ